MELAMIGRDDKSRQLATSNLLDSFIEFSRVVGSLIPQWDNPQWVKDNLQRLQLAERSSFYIQVV